MLEVREWTVEEGVENENAAAYIGRTLSLSDNRLKNIVKYHLCGINQRMITEESVVNSGDEISCTIPDRRPDHDIPYAYDLDVLYEDHYVAVINKPRDMAVIPGPGNWKESVAMALLHRYGKDAYFRIAHRIDKCTSGCLLITRTRKATRLMAYQLQNHTCARGYLAIVKGNVYEPGTIELPLERDPHNFRRMGVREDGRYALTMYEPMSQLNDASELKIRLKTGRTHQIRVHLAAIGHPLIGDDLYGQPFEPYDTKGALLHARTLEFIHPFTEEKMVITAPVPSCYETVKELLKSDCKD